MEDCTKCNICNNPGTFENSQEHKLINSNVRKFKDEKFTVWRCSNCLSLHSKESIDLAYYYDGYPVNNHKQEYGTHCTYRNRLRLLRKNGLKKEHKILDFGCGPGLFVLFLNQQGYNATGYDAFVEKFSDEGPLDKVYDFVVSYDVIEHAIMPKDFFNNLLKCLKKGGVLLIATPNAEKINLAEPDTFSMALHQPHHRHILSEKALLSLGKQVNLELLNIRYRSYIDTLYPMVNLKFLTRYVRNLGGIVDVAFEGFKPGTLLRSPILIFYGFFGYFFPQPATMMAAFRLNH